MRISKGFRYRIYPTAPQVRRLREWENALSARYAKSHGTVIVENLAIGPMVRTSRRLARTILDAGWGMLAERLKYKLSWSGGRLESEDPVDSSCTCNRCDHVATASRRSQAEFVCVACGLVEHADVNAAKVLLKRRVIRSADNSGEGKALEAPRRSEKRLRVTRRSSEKLRPSGRG